MMSLYRIILPIFLTLCLCNLQSGNAACVYGTEIAGKVDIGPALARVDVLESGKTVKRLNMAGVRGDLYFVFKDAYGFMVKPYALYLTGHHGELINTGISLGFCCPVLKQCTFSPLIGCAYTQLSTRIDIPVEVFPGFDVVFPDIHERFRSVSPYIGFEVAYTFCQGWRLSGLVQYGYSQTHTRLKGFPTGTVTDNSRSWGPSYSVMLEKDITEKWSINIAGAYNISLTKEKHGLRAAGGKIGIAYWF